MPRKFLSLKKVFAKWCHPKLVTKTQILFRVTLKGYFELKLIILLHFGMKDVPIFWKRST